MTTARRPRRAPAPPGSPAALARAAADITRHLSYATRGTGLDQPAAAYHILSALTATAGRTALILAQIAGYLRDAGTTGHLGGDCGHPPSQTIGAASAFLADAQMSAAALASDLEAACHQLACLQYRPPEPEPEPPF